MKRREFILSLASLFLLNEKLFSIGKSSFFEIGVIKYDGPYNMRNTGLKKLLWEISKRTSIEVSFDIADINLLNTKKLFAHPFLYLTGDSDFSFSKKEIKNLKDFLSFGGMVFIDSAEKEKGKFDNSVKKLIKKLYPQKKLVKAPENHVIYRTFNLLDRPYGRFYKNNGFLILEDDNRIEIIYSENDIIGALTVDEFGSWKYPVSGEEKTREMAFRTGVNIIMYATCLSYKADQVHIDYLLKNRR